MTTDQGNIIVSREEIDKLSQIMRIKGRSDVAVVHLKRESHNGHDNVLHYRHASGENWWPVPTNRDIHPSGASAPR